MPDRELLVALDGHLSGKKAREIAIELRDSAKVAAEWHADGGLRSLVRRRIVRAIALMEGGYRDLLTAG